MKRTPEVTVLETERLILRRLTTKDDTFILELLNEPSFVRFIGDRGVRTAPDARDYILKGPIDSYERHGYGLFLTALKMDNVPIGICGLVKRDFLSDADIGYAFLPRFWSQGFAVEAASAVMTYAREVLRLVRIVAIVSPDNERSINVLKKLGLRFERMIVWPGDGSQIKLFAFSV
jgi:RimJ/RimL family protein N-acetyltransferase